MYTNRRHKISVKINYLTDNIFAKVPDHQALSETAALLSARTKDLLKQRITISISCCPSPEDKYNHKVSGQNTRRKIISSRWT